MLLSCQPKPLIEMKAASQLNDEQQSRNGLANGQRSSWELDDEDVQTVLRSRMSTRSQDASDLVGNYESVLKKGFLDKCKTGSVKKWKKCYFVLNARNQVLYLFEDNTTVSYLSKKYEKFCEVINLIVAYRLLLFQLNARK